MSYCKTIRVAKRKLCTGDLDRMATINVRTSDGVTNGAGISQTFTKTLDVWAGIESKVGKEMFLSTNLDTAITHIFYMRYMPDIDATTWVKYNGQLYDIVNIEDLDERNEWLVVYTNLRGSESLAANHA